MSGELGALLRVFLDRHLATHAVSADQRRILRLLARCGTGELGYADYRCPDCDRVEQVPRGCGNRHCPRCQGRLARAWRERQQADLLETGYFHAVFTLPHALLPLGAARPAALYRLLFDAAAQTLLRLGRERLGGTLGVTMVLHTWGQQLNLHPHVHAIVTGGALDAAGRWHRAKLQGYLFPLAIMSAIFRGKFLAGLTALKASGALPDPPGGWPRLWRTLGSSKWVVYCKRPFAGPEQVLAYLSNYTHRVALSERRLVGQNETAGTVTFRWRDYREQGAVKLSTLPADEFLRRFRRHLLPRGFTKVRHYGLLANNARRKLVPLARAAIAAQAPVRRKPAAPPTATAGASEWPPPCAQCGGTRVVCRGLILPDGRYRAVRVNGALPAKAREPP